MVRVILVLMARRVILARLEQVVPQGMLVVLVTLATQVILVITVPQEIVAVAVLATQAIPATQVTLEKVAAVAAATEAALLNSAQSVLAKP